MKDRFVLNRLLVLLILGFPLYARGEKSLDLIDHSVYRINPLVDGTVIGVAALGAALPLVFEAQIIKKNCPCDSSEVPRIDRPVIQYHSAAARSAGDITVALALAAPPILDGMDLGFKDPAFVEDVVIYAEVLSVNSAISNAFRYTTQRPRPEAYRVSPAPSQPGAFASFYSGHTASVFAGLSAASMTYNMRYGPHVWPWVVTAVVGLGEASTRILAGRHFYTDVAAGIVAGTAIGITIPYLHKRNKTSTVTITPEFSADSAQLVFRKVF